MPEPAQSSRDHLVLVFSVTIMFGAAILGWAGQEVASATDAVLLGILPVQLILASLHIAAAGLTLLGFVTSLIFALLDKALLPERVVRILHQSWVGFSSFGALIFCPMAFILINRSRLQPVLTVLVGLAIGVLVLHLLYKRQPINTRQVILAGASATAGLLSVETFGVLQGWSQIYTLTYRLKLPAEVLYRTSLRWTFLLIAALFVVVPLTLILPPVYRHIRSAVGRVAQVPLPVLVAPIGAILIVHTAIWIGHRSPLLILINRLVMIVSLLAIIPLLYRDENPDAWPAALTLSAPTTRLIKWAIVGGYCVLVVPVAIAWIDVVNVDGLAYLQIAHHYAEGASAVRGLWSPLFSWLLIPAFRFNVDPFIAARAFNALVGLGWLAATDRLARRFDLSPVARLSVVAMTGLFFLKYGFWPLGPDSLSGLLLLIYFLLLLSGQWRRRPVWIGIVLGLLSAVAYYARAFNLPFILVHLLLTVIIFALIERRDLRPVILTASITILTLMVLSAPWIAALSSRYGHFTISIAGEYNRANIDSGFALPCGRTILCDQPADVLFPWEDPDPASYQSLGISPLSSVQSLASHLRGVGHNAAIWAYTTARNLTFLHVLAFVATAFLIFIDWPDAKRRRDSLWLLMTIVLYLAGYFQSVSAELRYYYPLIPLFIILLYRVIDRIASSWNLPPIQARWMAYLLVLGPLVAYLFHETGYAPEIELFVPPERCLVTDGQRLAPYLTAPIAGANLRAVESISFATQTRTYGSLSTEQVSPAEMHAQYQSFGIQTVIASRDDGIVSELIDDYQYRPVLTATFCGREIILLTP